MRLLITGSRTWDDPMPIEVVVERVAVRAGNRAESLTVVHGVAKGADYLAMLVVRQRRREGWLIAEEPHPANWHAACEPTCRPGHRKPRNGKGDFCPAVGMYRNKRMVDLGADVAVAFLRDGSPGTLGCMDLIKRAGIPLLVVRWEDRYQDSLAPELTTDPDPN